jgi:LysR family transcriptional regulator, hydrogen peroxide-inducible genes activator
MELNQVSYFINLAETLNFTAAARLSGVSQPSLTRAIRRLEDELGGPLIYRDGKNSRPWPRRRGRISAHSGRDEERPQSL